jgi:magnesium transporter
MQNHSNQFQVIKFKNFTELQSQIRHEHLPTNITEGIETPEVFPRTSTVKDDQGQTTYIVGLCNLVMMNIQTNFSVILDPLLIVSNPHQLTFFVHENSNTEDELQQLTSATQLDSNEAVIAHFLLHVYDNYRTKLAHIKKQLEHLEQQSSQTTKNEELIQLKNIKKDTVLLQHTLETQHHALEHLFKLDEFSKNLQDETVIYNIKTAERQITKLVEVYRDLIDAISGLFSDIMSNHLNHLMKYLDSAALVISVPSLIAGLWGMNTGGLPGRHTAQGFWSMVAVSGVLALITWIILRFKKFND